MYLDLALDGAVRTTVEGALEQLRSAAKPGSTEQLPQLLQICAACAENACLSTASNQELVLAFRDLQVNIDSSCSQASDSHACNDITCPSLGSRQALVLAFRDAQVSLQVHACKQVYCMPGLVLLMCLHAAVRSKQQ